MMEAGELCVCYDFLGSPQILIDLLIVNSIFYYSSKCRELLSIIIGQFKYEIWLLFIDQSEFRGRVRNHNFAGNGTRTPNDACQLFPVWKCIRKAQKVEFSVSWKLQNSYGLVLKFELQHILSSLQRKVIPRNFWPQNPGRTFNTTAKPTRTNFSSDPKFKIIFQKEFAHAFAPRWTQCIKNLSDFSSSFYKKTILFYFYYSQLGLLNFTQLFEIYY